MWTSHPRCSAFRLKQRISGTCMSIIWSPLSDYVQETLHRFIFSFDSLWIKQLQRWHVIVQLLGLVFQSNVICATNPLFAGAVNVKSNCAGLAQKNTILRSQRTILHPIWPIKVKLKVLPFPAEFTSTKCVSFFVKTVRLPFVKSALQPAITTTTSWKILKTYCMKRRKQ